MINGSLNSAEVLQRKNPSLCLLPLPLVRVLCYKDQESLNHIFIECAYAQHCWRLLFDTFSISWVLSKS